MITPNSRVVVIDDKYDDIKNLLEVLNRSGICFNHYTGNFESLPKKPLSNVRIIFLDFVLEDTFGQSNKNKVSKLIGTLEKIISKENGPFILLFWTNNFSEIELLEMIKESIRSHKSLPKPLLMVDLNKKDSVRSIQKIQKKIIDALNQENIFELMIEWEENCKNAVGDVLRTLIKISEIDNQSETLDDHVEAITKSLEKHIYEIYKSNFGENHVKNNNSLISNSQISLMGLLDDHIESRIKNSKKKIKKLPKKIIASGTSQKYGEGDIAEMNNHFLLIDGKKSIQPGNVYFLNPSFLKSKKILKKEIIEDTIEKDFLKKFDTSKKRKFFSKIKIVFLEFTPTCDYDQNKWKNPRLVAGIMIPFDKSNKNLFNNHKNYTYNPTLIKYDNQVLQISFNAHYLLDINKRELQKVNPLFKLRKDFIVDIQHWISQHLSRPGKIQFN